MKKISTETTGLMSLILLAATGIFGIGQLVFSLISPETILGWLKSAHVSYYSASTAVAPKMTAFVMGQSFENLFTVGYIRIMSMYIFVLCLPLAYALFNIFLISQNGKSNKPFRSSTNACLKSVTIAFIGEFLLATILFVILKLIMRTLPFYFMYTMMAVALYSLVLITFSMTISGLINRMGDLRNEHAKKIRKQQAEAEKDEVSELSEKKYKAETSFDDVLNSIDK